MGRGVIVDEAFSMAVIGEEHGRPRAVTFVGARPWVHLYATWQPWTRAALSDLPSGELGGFALESLRGVLEEAGAVPVGAAHVQFTEPGGDLFTRNVGVVVLAEVVGLVLVHPDPMPVVVLFPRLWRVERRVRSWWWSAPVLWWRGRVSAG